MAATTTTEGTPQSESQAAMSRALAKEAPSDRLVLTRRNVADVAVLLVLSVLGVIGFEPTFGGLSFVLAGLGGLAVGAATGILAAIFRLGPLTTTLVAIVGYFLLGTPFAVSGQALLFVFPSLQSLSSLAVGAVYGWADILTLGTPIGAPAYIAVIPFFAAWLVALAAVTLAIRWLPRDERSAWRLGVVLVGPVLLYLAGVLLGTRDPYLAGIRGITFAVLALLWLGWRRKADGQAAVAGADRLRRRKLVGTAVLLSSAVVLGGGTAFVLAPPNESRFVLREEIEPPFDPLQYPSPLAGFRHYTKAAEETVLFTVEGLAPGDVLRLATLDSFNGKLWTATGPQQSTNGSGSFSLVGSEVPPPRFITSDRSAEVTITIVGYDDVWMPGVGYPVEFELLGGTESDSDSLRYNSATGTSVLTTGLSEGDSYRIVAQVQSVVDPAELETVGLASVDLPPVEASPDIVTAKAIEFAGDATNPAATLEAIRRALVDGGYLSHGRASDAVASRAGHGADRVQELLERPQMVGDAEQYASAFALMARSFGYPARVVMGFRPDIGESQATVEVVGDDVTAWVEVAFDGVGWVAFDPTPEETDIPQDETPKPQSEPQPQVRQPPRAEHEDEDLLTPVELEKTDDDGDDIPFEIPGWVYVVALSLLIPAAIVFVPMLVVAFAKYRRSRSRRESGAVHDQVAGAWEELSDRYVELGFEVPKKLTRTRAAEVLEAQVPHMQRGHLRFIALATDEVVFSGAEIAPERSDAVWTEAMAAVELARTATTGWRRLASRYRMRRARRARASKPVPGASRKFPVARASDSISPLSDK